MCIWKLIHTEKLTSILVTVNGNDLMPPVTPEEKLAGDVQTLVQVVGSMSVRATFLIGDGSAQLLKQDPGYNAKVENLRGMFTALGCHVSTMGDFARLRMADSLHFHPEGISVMAPAVLRLLQEAQEAPVQPLGIWHGGRLWPREDGWVIMKRNCNNYYYALCLKCSPTKNATLLHMQRKHKLDIDFERFDFMGKHTLPTTESPLMSMKTFHEKIKRQCPEDVLLVAPPASLANAQATSAIEDAWVECTRQSGETVFGREWECAVGAPRGLHSDQDSRAEQEQEEAPAISTPDPWADSTPALGLSADELVRVGQALLADSCAAGASHKRRAEPEEDGWLGSGSLKTSRRAQPPSASSAQPGAAPGPGAGNGRRGEAAGDAGNVQQEEAEGDAGRKTPEEEYHSENTIGEPAGNSSARGNAVGSVGPAAISRPLAPQFRLRWLLVALIHLQEFYSQAFRWYPRQSQKITDMLCSAQCAEFLRSARANSAARQGFLAAVRTGLVFLLPRHNNQVTTSLAELGIHVTENLNVNDVDVVALIEEARTQSGAQSAEHVLSDEQHDTAHAHIRSVFESRYIVNPELKRLIRKRDRDGQRLTKQDKKALQSRRRGALSVWIKSLVGDEQIFYAQLRRGVMNAQEKDAMAVALVEARREAASANGPPDAMEDRMALRESAVAARQELKRARKSHALGEIGPGELVEMEARVRERDVAYGLQQFRILCRRAFLPSPFICWRGRLRAWVWIRFGFGREVWASCGALTRAGKKKQSGTTSVVRRMFEGRGLTAKKSSATLRRSGPSWQLLQPWSWSRHPPNAGVWAGGGQGLRQLSPLNTGEHGRFRPRAALSCAGVSARWRYASCRAAFSRALLFSMFVCWGGCFTAAFPCAPFKRWRRASCRTWASSFFFSSGVEQPASQHVLHQKQAKRRQATALTLVASKCIYHV